MPGPRPWHGGTIRHGTATSPCSVVSCLAVLVPCRAWVAQLAMYSVGPNHVEECVITFSTVVFFFFSFFPALSSKVDVVPLRELMWHCLYPQKLMWCC
jgi:hypothetical protein